MAKILNTESCWKEIKKIISDANKFIVLISPYIGSCDIVSLVNNRKNNTYLQLFTLEPQFQSYRGSVNKTLVALSLLPNVKVRLTNNDIHAKCYFNENEVLLCSLNLSNIDKLEFGVLISREWDSSLFLDTMKLVNEICFMAGMEPESLDKLSNHRSGYCIRCRKSIDLNISFPYCSDCFSFNDSFDYCSLSYTMEKYCHFCGRRHASYRNFPMHYNCYHEYIDLMNKFGSN